MAVALATLKTKTRGRNSRELEYQGLGKQAEDGSVDASGSVTDIDDAIGLVGSLQDVLDRFAIGFNYMQRNAVLDTDEFAGLLDDVDWTAVAAKAGLKDDEKAGTAIEQAQGSFKRSVRAAAKASGADVETIVPLLKSLLAK